MDCMYCTEIFLNQEGKKLNDLKFFMYVYS